LSREKSYLPTGQGDVEYERADFFTGQAGVRSYLPTQTTFLDDGYRIFSALMGPEETAALDASTEPIEFGLRLTTEVSNSAAGDFDVIYRIDDFGIEARYIPE